MVSNRTQHPHPLPAPHCVYMLYFDSGKGEGGRDEPERRLKGQQFTKLGLKYPHDWLFLQSINSDKLLPQSPLQDYFLEDDILFLVVLMLISPWSANM